MQREVGARQHHEHEDEREAEPRLQIAEQVERRIASGEIEIAPIAPGGVEERETYFRIDTRSMFQTSVHAVVREMIEELCETTGRPVPSEAEFKPIMKEFFKR